jgi:hypothetical protein
MNADEKVAPHHAASIDILNAGATSAMKRAISSFTCA